MVDNIPDTHPVWDNYPEFYDAELVCEHCGSCSLTCLCWEVKGFDNDCDECLANDWHEDYTQCANCAYN